MIQIFQQEIDAGLVEIVQANASIAFSSIAKKIDVDSSKLPLTLANHANAGANPNQLDLFYLETVLASIGWNDNDDIFMVPETFNARATPVDKQFNFMHDESDIIGHITSSKVVALDESIIPDDTKIEDLPGEFDIVCGSVLYTSWANEELFERMQKITAGIAKGEWFVSMECLFHGFDYGLINEADASDRRIVTRNEATAGLTKHLRIYGGTGSYNGYKVGRALKNFAFSGKGLVDNPANKRSVIISGFTGKQTASIILQENTKMADTYSKEQYDALHVQLEKSEAARKDADSKEMASLKITITELETSKATVTDELKNVTSLSAEKDTKITTLEATAVDGKVATEKLEAELAEIQTTAKNSLRLSQLTSAGVDADKSKMIVDKFATASDEMFAEVVELHKSIAVTPDQQIDATNRVQDGDVNEDGTLKTVEAGLHDPAEDKKRKEKEEKEKAKALDEAKADKTLNLSTESTEGDEATTIRSAASSWLKASLYGKQPQTTDSK